MNAGRIFTPGPEGSWDDAKVSCPVVVVDGGRYRMWHYGRERGFPGAPGPGSPFGRTGYAESDDGLHWTRVPGPGFRGSVLDPSDDPDRFDSYFLGGTSVVRAGEGYRLYYFGARQLSGDERAERQADLLMAIGVAEGPDGLHFTKIDGDAGHGAVIAPGAPGAFDSRVALLPRVMPLDGGWRMYYHGSGPDGAARIAIAESDDGIHWEKRGPIFGPNPDQSAFDARSVNSRSVIEWAGGWLMAYEALAAGGTHQFSIGLATSPDGLRWERLPGRGPGGCALPRGEPGAWDALSIGTPWLLPMPDGSLRLYYVGFSEQAETAIGMAVCDGKDLTRWERYLE
jgi:hypothetical protein